MHGIARLAQSNPHSLASKPATRPSFSGTPIGVIGYRESLNIADLDPFVTSFTFYAENPIHNDRNSTTECRDTPVGCNSAVVGTANCILRRSEFQAENTNCYLAGSRLRIRHG